MSSNIKAPLQRDSWRLQDKNTTSTHNFNSSTLHSASEDIFASFWNIRKANGYKAHMRKQDITAWKQNGTMLSTLSMCEMAEWLNYLNWCFSVKCISHSLICFPCTWEVVWNNNSITILTTALAQYYRGKPSCISELQ